MRPARPDAGSMMPVGACCFHWCLLVFLCKSAQCVGLAQKGALFVHAQCTENALATSRKQTAAIGPSWHRVLAQSHALLSRQILVQSLAAVHAQRSVSLLLLSLCPTCVRYGYSTMKPNHFYSTSSSERHFSVGP